MDMKRFFLYFIVIAALALAGCGGNGGGTAMGPDTTPPTAGERAMAAAIALAIADPDGDKMFPETGDLKGAMNGRPMRSWMVEVDALNQIVSVREQGQGEAGDAAIGVPFIKSMETPRDIMDWMGSRHMRTRNDLMETVTVYTNVEAPGPQAWADYYGEPDKGGVAGSVDMDGKIMLKTDGNLDALQPLFMVAGMPTKPSGYEEYMAGDYKGSFNGIDGTYTCSGGSGCEIKTDDMGKLRLVTGDWAFTPTVATGGTVSDVMIPGVVADEDYLKFGYWTDSDSMGMGINVFAEGSMPFGGVEDVSVAVARLEGSATYAGPATGMFVTKDADGPAHSGQFTADAMLTATFGDAGNAMAKDLFQISGSVDKFVLMDGERMVENDWMLTLNPAAFSTSTEGRDATTGMPNGEYTYSAHTNTFSGTTEGGGGAGEWNGMFYGEATEGVDAMMDDPGTPGVDESAPAIPPSKPSGVAGTFLGHFDDGHAIGAFGAPMPMPEDAMPNN